MKIPSRLIALLFVAAFVVVPFHQSEAQSILNPRSGPDTASAPTADPITPYSGSIATIVAAQPAGTAFSLACGTYRMQATIRPLPGDSFVGAGAISGVPASPPCADLNGSVVLNSWTAGSGTSAGTWYKTISSADVIDRHSKAPCNSSDRGCEYPQDLFFNSVPKIHVTASFPPQAGQWYLDYTGMVGQHVADTVYVGDDPISSTVELSVMQTAFAGPASNVTVQNLTIEKYATSTQHGTVTTRGYHWAIENNWLDLNHGEAIELDDAANALVSYNRTTQNGQAGLSAGGSGEGKGDVFSNNLVTQNNFAGIAYSFEAGGGKFSANDSLKVINNTFSNNNGNGLWGDEGDTNAIFAGNTVDHNIYNGITYEISHSGVIVRNRLTSNAQAAAAQCIAAHVPILERHDVCTGPGTCSGWACNACSKGRSEIWLHTSDTSTVGGSAANGNTIVSNCAGIQINEDGRLRVRGNTVSYNTLILHTGSGVINTILGGDNDPFKSEFNMYSASPPNTFDHNSYTFDSLTASQTRQHWQWQLDDGAGNQAYNWSGWRAKVAGCARVGVAIKSSDPQPIEGST